VPFIAMANVALYFALNAPALVPDVLLSTNVELPVDPLLKDHRSYFTWLYGKSPDVVIEIVSNREGGELDRKLRGYAAHGVPYYVVFDPG
jgi:Uma2 family endonuclease